MSKVFIINLLVGESVKMLSIVSLKSLSAKAINDGLLLSFFTGLCP